MKTMITLILCCCITGLFASVKEREAAVATGKKILIVSTEENVASNYYPLSMIAEELKIDTDSVNVRLNGIVAESMTETNPMFVCVNENKELVEKVIKQIKVTEASATVSVADLSGVRDEDYQNLLREAGADYVLVINGYYLNKQEQPMNTIFHTISFSIYDKDKKSILTNSGYYNTITLTSCKEVKEASKKCTQKMTKAILKKVLK